MTALSTNGKIWSSYWRSHHTRCPLLSAEPALAAQFGSYWAEAVNDLPAGARVLDLACGNGFVALAIADSARRMNKVITVDAIDVAAIDPKRSLGRTHPLVDAITFHGQTEMEALPFEAGTFDAVFSQYGIEYGDITKAAREIGRVLKPGGVVRLLSQSAQSQFIQKFETKARCAKRALGDKRLFSITAAVAQALQGGDPSDGARRPQAYLSKFSAEVKRVMDEHDEAENGLAIATVSVLQQILTNRNDMSLGEQILEIDKLKKGLSDLVVRSETVAKSALGEASLAKLVSELKKSGVAKARAVPQTDAANQMVAWNIVN